jgi:hypothetical protein
MTITETDLLSELAAEITLPPLLPDDVTIGRLANKCNPPKAERTVKKFLDNKVASGEMVKVKCMNEYGKAITAYRKAEG